MLKGLGNLESTIISMLYLPLTTIHVSRYSVPENSEDEYKMKRKELAERISNKLHAAFWVVTTCLLCYYTDLFRVLIEDKRVNR